MIIIDGRDIDSFDVSSYFDDTGFWYFFGINLPNNVYHIGISNLYTVKARIGNIGVWV